jgi:hypothetical protein
VAVIVVVDEPVLTDRRNEAGGVAEGRQRVVDLLRVIDHRLGGVHPVRVPSGERRERHLSLEPDEVRELRREQHAVEKIRDLLLERGGHI